MNNKVFVLDSIMGSGKTTKIIDWMIANPQEKYLYVSPLLSEVEERIPVACRDAIGFSFPVSDDETTKSKSFLELLRAGQNVSTTHTLFSLMTKEHLKLIKDQGYILIVDEEVNMIENFSTKYGDLDSLRAWEVIDVDQQNYGQVKVLKPTDSGSFKYLFDYAKTNSLFATKDNNNALVVQLPIELLLSAKKVIILTYKFKGSILSKFLDMNNLTYIPFTEFDMPDEKELKAQIKKLLTIATTPSIDALSKRAGFLSTTWYNEGNARDFVALRSALASIYRKHPKDTTLITCPKSAVDTRHSKSIHDNKYINPKVSGPKQGWLACHTRATNEFADKTVMIHAYDRYPNRNVDSYLTSWGHSIDRGNYALSEMIQWLWRGCIRNGEPMTVYILSDRMKNLLINWLNSQEEELLDLAI
ncbi:hypothetical protein [Paracoccus haeundaensis]|uniref:Uncharacterized protein n=1 Tax=Paracoccus haeundaensis TaxID=225362 RepID=A0A5C4R5W8_9RHOB|nr:hypothetical protein [Paracoccus haeundaensis]TNH39319.1 hypothetical protein FHD67_10315 [Paracoccus haeundaensis]